MSEPIVRTPWLLTLVAMLAFAANSLLCRMALGSGAIDAASFATLRICSGAVVLGLLVLPRWRSQGRAKTDWRAVAMLFVYVACFSFAYLSLSAGTGALILFAAVQLTMFIVSLRGGEQFSAVSWLGLALAAAGFVYLVAPGLTAPDPFSAMLMTLAGIAWGFYSLLGRGVSDPVQSSASNFIGTVPFVAATSLIFLGQLHMTISGALLAIASGAIASGLGYVVWYAALRRLTGTRAATVQLSVPVIAAFGGVLLLSEPLTIRLVIASIATLGGVWLVLAQRLR